MLCIFYSTFLFTSRDLDSCLSQTSVMTFLTTTLIPFIILSYALIKIRQKMHIILLHKEYILPVMFVLFADVWVWFEYLMITSLFFIDVKLSKRLFSAEISTDIPLFSPFIFFHKCFSKLHSHLALMLCWCRVDLA